MITSSPGRLEKDFLSFLIFKEKGGIEFKQLHLFEISRLAHQWIKEGFETTLV